MVQPTIEPTSNYFEEEGENNGLEGMRGGGRGRQKKTHTHIFSNTMPLAMEEPPRGLAFIAVTEWDLL